MNNNTVLELENISYKYKNDLILNKVNLKNKFWGKNCTFR